MQEIYDAKNVIVSMNGSHIVKTMKEPQNQYMKVWTKQKKERIVA